VSILSGIDFLTTCLQSGGGHYAEFFLVGLDVIYIVPTMASIKTIPLKSQVYGAKNIEMSENVHTETNDITFARSGIVPVSRKLPTWRPNKRLLTTNL
jgi:hypothetical protein